MVMTSRLEEDLELGSMFAVEDFPKNVAFSLIFTDRPTPNYPHEFMKKSRILQS